MSEMGIERGFIHSTEFALVADRHFVLLGRYAVERTDPNQDHSYRHGPDETPS